MRKKNRYTAAALVTAAIVAAFAAPGTASAATSPISLDTAFGTGGIATGSLGGLTGSITNAAVESNGDIVVSGSFGLARFLPNGTLDTSFGTGGVVSGIDGNAQGLAIQPDGKIITAGKFIIRYNANGTLDTTFGNNAALDAAIGIPGGLATIPAITVPGAEQVTGDLAQTVLVQPDGKILIAGGASAQFGPRSFGSDGYVARLNSNGSADASFGTGGGALITSGPEISALALDSAGDIFGIPFVGGIPATPPEVELSASGAVDTTVTPAPLVAQSRGALAPAFIPSGGYVNPTFNFILRHATDAVVNFYTPAGTLASSTGKFVFGGTSGTVLDITSQAIVLPNGETLAIGSHNPSFNNPGTAVTAFAEVNPNGTLNSSFGTGGVALAPSSVGQGFPVLEPDGTLVIVGATQIPAANTLTGTEEALTLTRINI